MRKTKSPSALAARGASEIDGLGQLVVSNINRQQQLSQVPIRATLIGSNCCEAEGISARGYAPGLDLCRALIKAGHDPKRALHAYRGEVLALAVRSIGEGARFTVEDSRGTPHLRHWRDRSKRYGAGSPVAQIADGRGVTHPEAAGHPGGRAMTALSENGAEWASTAQFDPLRIDYVVTVDEVDGRPVPPGFVTDDIYWGEVAQLPGGRTLWRRIELLQPLTTRRVRHDSSLR